MTVLRREHSHKHNTHYLRIKCVLRKQCVLRAYQKRIINCFEQMCLEANAEKRAIVRSRIVAYKWN